MTSLKPYLIRAIYDWIVDNQFTPYLLVDAEAQGVVVPRQYVQDGKIVLNLRPQAVHGLSLGNQEVEFGARFGGTPMQITVPMRAVLAIYAQENGKGMIFDDEGDDDTPPPADSAPQTPSTKKKPVLKVVK
ncbi:MULTISPECIES: ClpXP protease specificity-enhancing factor [Methylocaldum]|jgi:stringent starvation protein B|uniref:ClpXP protease specificity-enhancing factor n=2 Tax=Methylocaldum TaxID=73778 RepID=UPI00098B26B8|nr:MULTISPECIES: ClpXP protease specificity-enhancing factor [unclassified Methylocaldum]MBP1148875.1 stringent starvation protein B [Methylocaldum sp. RMAD-M]MDV3242597.1 ClpXP protease specificity-enhancing factor [Methylocaldum sp.]MVF20658.1 ClpXP protease specificity-enhancing factor [Methylocaldum sp. BRCS4]